MFLDVVPPRMPGHLTAMRVSARRTFIAAAGLFGDPTSVSSQRGRDPRGMPCSSTSPGRRAARGQCSAPSQPVVGSRRRRRMRGDRRFARQRHHRRDAGAEAVGAARMRRVTGESERRRRYRRQAVGVDDVQAARAFARIPRPCRAAGRVPRREMRGHLQAPTRSTSPSRTAWTFTAGNAWNRGPNATWGSSSVGMPRSSAVLPGALAATVAPLTRCSAAMPPA